MSQRAGRTVVEVKGSSHGVYVSQPEAVAALIEKAAAGAMIAAMKNRAFKVGDRRRSEAPQKQSAAE